MPKTYFEDLTEGERLQCEEVCMTREEIIEFATKYDPQPFHVDEAAARGSIFGGLVASSLHTLSACTRTVVQALEGVAVVGGVGLDAVRMSHPVRPGDVLTVHAWWADLKPSRGNPRHGLATVRCRVCNQTNDPIMEYGYNYLVEFRRPQGASGRQLNSMRPEG